MSLSIHGLISPESDANEYPTIMVCSSVGSLAKTVNVLISFDGSKTIIGTSMISVSNEYLDDFTAAIGDNSANERLNSSMWLDSSNQINCAKSAVACSKLSKATYQARQLQADLAPESPPNPLHIRLPW